MEKGQSVTAECGFEPELRERRDFGCPEPPTPCQGTHCACWRCRSWPRSRSGLAALGNDPRRLSGPCRDRHRSAPRRISSPGPGRWENRAIGGPASPREGHWDSVQAETRSATLREQQSPSAAGSRGRGAPGAEEGSSCWAGSPVPPCQPFSKLAEGSIPVQRAGAAPSRSLGVLPAGEGSFPGPPAVGGMPIPQALTLSSPG